MSNDDFTPPKHIFATQEDGSIEKIQIRQDGIHGEGTEGYAVFSKDGAHCIKIFKPEFIDLKRPKIEPMLAGKFVHLRLSISEYFYCWPTASATETKYGDIIGYVMPNAADTKPLDQIFAESNPDWAHLIARDRYQIAILLAKLHRTLDDCGVIISDANPANIRFKETKTGDWEVYLIDTDSCQFDYQNTVYTGDIGIEHYSSPRLLSEYNAKGDWVGIKRTAEDHHYSLAVTIFWTLLMAHPMRTTGVKSIAPNTEKHLFPYTDAIYALPDHAPIDAFKALPSSLIDLFHETFSKGNPSDPYQWMDTLEEALVDLPSTRPKKVKSPKPKPQPASYNPIPVNNPQPIPQQFRPPQGYIGQLQQKLAALKSAVVWACIVGVVLGVIIASIQIQNFLDEPKYLQYPNRPVHTEWQENREEHPPRIIKTHNFVKDKTNYRIHHVKSGRCIPHISYFDIDISKYYYQEISNKDCFVVTVRLDSRSFSSYIDSETIKSQFQNIVKNNLITEISVLFPNKFGFGELFFYKIRSPIYTKDLFFWFISIEKPEFERKIRNELKNLLYKNRNLSLIECRYQLDSDYYIFHYYWYKNSPPEKAWQKIRSMSVVGATHNLIDEAVNECPESAPYTLPKFTLLSPRERAEAGLPSLLKFNR